MLEMELIEMEIMKMTMEIEKKNEKVIHDQVIPDGLRVLLVDNDLDSLLKMEAMLQSCRYCVTARERSKDALLLLREKKDEFDILLTGVDMSDMDGFELLDIVTAEIKSLPIVMFSHYQEEVVRKGIMRGASAILAKPVSMEDLQVIWQHVFRNKIKTFHQNTIEDRNAAGSAKSTAIREKPTTTSGTAKKKARVNWTPELQQQFSLAMSRIRNKSDVVPKKILESMQQLGVSGLTRQNIASHLQKVRNHIKKFEEEQVKLSTLTFPVTVPVCGGTAPNNYLPNTASYSCFPVQPIRCDDYNNLLPPSTSPLDRFSMPTFQFGGSAANNFICSLSRHDGGFELHGDMTHNGPNIQEHIVAPIGALDGGGHCSNMVGNSAGMMSTSYGTESFVHVPPSVTAPMILNEMPCQELEEIFLPYARMT